MNLIPLISVKARERQRERGLTRKHSALADVGGAEEEDARPLLQRVSFLYLTFHFFDYFQIPISIRSKTLILPQFDEDEDDDTLNFSLNSVPIASATRQHDRPGPRVKTENGLFSFLVGPDTLSHAFFFFLLKVLFVDNTNYKLVELVSRLSN